MNNKLKILSFIASVSIAASSFAQTAPEGYTVDSEGNLLLDGSIVANKPSGTVDSNGALVIDGGDPIAAPDATVLEDGRLDLGNGTILDVPELPSADGLIGWLGDSVTATDITNDQGRWYYSDKLKYVFHYENLDTAAGGWLFSVELNATLFVFAGETTSPETGYFAYTSNWRSSVDSTVVAQPSFVWVFGSENGNFTTPNESDTLRGWFWLFTPSGASAGAYYFSEFSGGNYILRNGGTQDDWVQLTNPIPAS